MTPEQLTGQNNQHLSPLRIGQKWFDIHSEVHTDLIRLIEAAHLAGFECYIASGFRDFDRQQIIWERKFSGQSRLLDSQSQPLESHLLSSEEKMWAILRWSALPGGSRHHWGTDFDLYAANHLPSGQSLQLEPWEYLSGHQHTFYRWLVKNAPDFGFYFPYDQDRGGVAIEPWHISHKAIATQCMQALSLDILYQQLLKKSFIGQATVLKHLDTIYTRYVTNISL
ncbi:peptidase M15 [Vibrio sp. 10N.286.49.B3]|uniref:M15 family metallopeptidase n=1 Tax=Vibrio sp. 10N.286.49.B3 TaxID=1880855 RepID=UPI000C833815|nr:M15 family metallopeptidase [Vibrio sp. 10N.286.49.B3]PMH41059.1 peptidase M15 [Vibrio sp. 10N.286.49.B3]